MSGTRSTGGMTYDVAVIGSGLVGSMLGAILARKGARVLIVDGGQHPKVTFGESTTPRASVALRALAERYDVPEIKTLTTFENCTRIIGPSFGIRNHFGFLSHREGERQNPREACQATNGPLSAGAHLPRATTDAYLFHAALRHGAVAEQNCRLSGVEFDDSGVTLSAVDGREFRARYVVDTSGRHSVLAKQLAVRDAEPRFRHRSRMMWNHFVKMPRTDAVLAGRQPAPPVPWYEGTLHHLFDGGWFWVIPFDNHERSRSLLCSVGLTLDTRKHAAAGTSAEDEFRSQAARFPDVDRQFAGAAPVREWATLTDLQYSSSQVVGDRWCLVGDSAGYVDPLFGRDLSDAAEVLNALAWRLLRAVRDDDFSAERFDYVARLQQGLLDFDDDLVSTAYASFSSFPLFNAIFRIWSWGSGAGTFRLQEAVSLFRRDGRDSHFVALEDAQHPGFCWPTHDGFKRLFDEAVAKASAYEAGEVSGAAAAADLFAMLRDADFVPKHVGFAEDTNFIHPTPGQVVKSLSWARREADPELRRLLVVNAKESLRTRLPSRLAS